MRFDFGLSVRAVGIPSWFEISDAKSRIVTSGLGIYKSLGHAVNHPEKLGDPKKLYKPVPSLLTVSKKEY